MSCACTCLIVDDHCVRRYTPLPSEVGFAAIEVDLRIAQDTSLDWLIGESCAQGLCDRYEDDALTDADNALLACLQPWLAWQAYASWLRKSGTQVGAAGVQRAESRAANAYDDHALAVRSDQIGKAMTMISHYRNKAYALLEDNPGDYPCYEPCKQATKTPIVVVS